MAAYTVSKDEIITGWPWTVSRDGRVIAHLRTEERANEYRDYLIEKENGDDD